MYDEARIRRIRREWFEEDEKILSNRVKILHKEGVDIKLIALCLDIDIPSVLYYLT